MPDTPPQPAPRPVYCVLSARSLPYARFALESLLANCLDRITLTLITDDAADELALEQAMVDALARRPAPLLAEWKVRTKADIDLLARDQFRHHPNLQGLREGHPCWRKITDPYLCAGKDEELVLLDPDLYFPNPFHFEVTPAKGILLMWQPPSCLLPTETVHAAYDAGFALAHHVDIGVAHARRNWDLDWLDALVGKIGGAAIPRMMHVEALLWAALAMKEGGGYLSPRHWHCWRNSQWKRLLRKVGFPGHQLLRCDRFRHIKCFHGGGAAKWWIPAFLAKQMAPAPVPRLEADAPLPFQELTRRDYDGANRLRTIARRLGYYRLMGK